MMYAMRECLWLLVIAACALQAPGAAGDEHSGQTPTTPGDFTGTVLSPKPPASTPPKPGSPSAGTPASPGAAGKSPAATPAAPAADAPPTGPELPASVQATIPGTPGEKLVEPSGKTATFTAMDPSSSGKPLWWKSGAGGRRRLNEAVAPSPMTRSNPATPSVTPAMPSAAAAPPSGYRRHLLNQAREDSFASALHSTRHLNKASNTGTETDSAGNMIAVLRAAAAQSSTETARTPPAAAAKAGSTKTTDGQSMRKLLQRETRGTQNVQGGTVTAVNGNRLNEGSGAIARAVETPNRLAQPTERRAATTQPDYTTMPGITSPAGLLPGGEREQPATGKQPSSGSSAASSGSSSGSSSSSSSGGGGGGGGDSAGGSKSTPSSDLPPDAKSGLLGEPAATPKPPSAPKGRTGPAEKASKSTSTTPGTSTGPQAGAQAGGKNGGSAASSTSSPSDSSSPSPSDSSPSGSDSSDAAGDSSSSGDSGSSSGSGGSSSTQDSAGNTKGGSDSTMNGGGPGNFPGK